MNSLNSLAQGSSDFSYLIAKNAPEYGIYADLQNFFYFSSPKLGEYQLKRVTIS